MISLHMGEDMAKKVLSAPKVSKGSRYLELKAMLEERKTYILAEIQGRLRVNRVESQKGTRDKIDSAKDNVPDAQEDIEFALIQMKAETLAKIDSALTRLGEGKYGYCLGCGKEINQQRLRALPFAVRCKDCEQERENQERLDKKFPKLKQPSRFFPPKGK